MRTVTVRLADEDPPAGSVIDQGGNEVPFSGWLGMLQVLSDLFDATPEPPTDGSST